MDPASITSILTVGSNVISLLKTTAEALKAAGKPDAVGAVVEAQLAMMDLLQKEQALLDDNRALRERVRTLEETLSVRESLLYRHRAYWRQTPEGALDGPYAPSQWDIHQRLVRMARTGRDTWDDGEKIIFSDSNSKDSTNVPVAFLREAGALVLADEKDGK